MSSIEQSVTTAYPKNMTDYRRPPSDALILDNNSGEFVFDLIIIN